MFKKILSTTMSLFLVTGISCSSASASFPNLFFPIVIVREERLIKQNFLNNYGNLIDQPLDNLLRTFTRSHSFNYVNPVDGRPHAMIFRNDAQAINLAVRINNLRRRLEPIAASAIPIFTGGIDPCELPSLAELQQYNAEITSLITEVNSLPANKPTLADFESGRCTDSHLMDD